MGGLTFSEESMVGRSQGEEDKEGELWCLYKRNFKKLKKIKISKQENLENSEY